MTPKEQLARLIVKRLNKLHYKKSRWCIEVNFMDHMWAVRKNGGFSLEGFIKHLPEFIDNPAHVLTVMEIYKEKDHPHVILMKDFLENPKYYMKMPPSTK